MKIKGFVIDKEMSRRASAIVGGLLAQYYRNTKVVIKIK